MKKYVLLLVVVSLVFACKDTKDKSPEPSSQETTEIAADYKSVEVVIEGMTCEIGCAKLIESKLSKTDGVKFSKIHFESRTGQITFDSNKLSKEAISKRIADIAGGDLYSVSQISDIAEVAEVH